MTSVPASIFGLKDRGIVKEGAFADLAIFDSQQIRDTATYDNPKQFAEGIRYVIVNGRVVLREGRFSEARPGRALRREGTTPNPFIEKEWSEFALRQAPNEFDPSFLSSHRRGGDQGSMVQIQPAAP